MSRPKGSKNKCPVLKEKVLEPVAAVEKPLKKERVKKTPTTIDTQPKTEDILYGQLSAESASEQAVGGYVNIQRNPRGGFYTGGDIHELVDDAKRYANKNTVATIYISFGVK